MTPRFLGTVALGAALWSMPAAAAGNCPVQPMPAALDAVRPPESSYVVRLISFSATPSLQSPRESWVVRVYTETVFEQDRREREVLEIMRLRGEYDCNRWFVTGRWQGELAPGEVAEICERALPFLEPAAQALSAGGRMASSDSLMLDGTGVAVEVRGFDWMLRRGTLRRRNRPAGIRQIPRPRRATGSGSGNADARLAPSALAALCCFQRQPGGEEPAV